MIKYDVYKSIKSDFNCFKTPDSDFVVERYSDKKFVRFSKLSNKLEIMDYMISTGTENEIYINSPVFVGGRIGSSEGESSNKIENFVSLQTKTLKLVDGISNADIDILQGVSIESGSKRYLYGDEYGIPKYFDNKICFDNGGNNSSLKFNYLQKDITDFLSSDTYSDSKFKNIIEGTINNADGKSNIIETENFIIDGFDTAISINEITIKNNDRKTFFGLMTQNNNTLQTVNGDSFIKEGENYIIKSSDFIEGEEHKPILAFIKQDFGSVEIIEDEDIKGFRIEIENPVYKNNSLVDGNIKLYCNELVEV